MSTYIFKTDIYSKKMIEELKPVFNRIPYIVKWSVDTEDVDNVLRVEVTSVFEESDIIKIVNTYGFDCEVLN